MKKVIHLLSYIALATAIVALVVTPVFSNGNGSAPKGKPFVAIQGQLIEVKGEIQSVKGQIAEITASVSSISEAVQQTQTDISELQSTNELLQAQLAGLLINYENLMTQCSELVAANEALDLQLAALLETNDATQEQLDDLRAQSESNTAQIEAIMGAYGELALLAAEMENLTVQVQANTATRIALQEEVLPELQRLSGVMNNILAGNCSDGQAVREILQDGTLVCESGPLLISPLASWPGELVQVEASWYPTGQTTTEYVTGQSCDNCGNQCYYPCRSCCWDCGLFTTCCGTSCSHCGAETYCFCNTCTYPVQVTTYPYSEFSLSLSCPAGHVLTQWGYQAPFSEDTISENYPTVTVDGSGNAITGYALCGEHAESTMQTYVTATATCLGMP